MLDVEKVMLHTLPYLLQGVGFAAPAVDLGPPRDSRFHPMSCVVVLDGFRIEEGAGLGRESMWTWTDDRHVAAQYVQELGQFVQARAPQEGADAGNPRVVALSQPLGIAVAHLLVHGAELQHL